MIWTSEYEPVDVGGATVHGLLEQAAARHARKIALADGASGRHVDYAELQRRVERISAWLVADGFGPSDRLALWAPNVPPFAAFSYAAMRAGGAVTGINPAATEREVRTQVDDAGVSVIVTIPDLVDSARGLGVRRVIVLGDTDGDGDGDGAVPLRAVLASDAPATPAATDEDAVALLPYSSGTTGLPKGVVLTHRQLVTTTRQLSVPLGVGPDDVTLAAAPFFHILGFTAELLVPLSAGAKVVTLDRFAPEQFVALLETHAVTYCAVPPPVVSMLLGHPAAAGRSFPHLRLLGCGGAALPASAQAALQQKLPTCVVGQGWGLTETSGAISIPDSRTAPKPGTVSRLLPNTELRVVDPTGGHDLDAGEAGELWVRGPQVMTGYLNRESATREMIDDDGWLRTGDLGFVDDDGSIVIVDRLKELIKVNAMQVAPAELEGLLVTHDAVADAAVIGRPDDRTGEVPVAYVVPSSESLDTDEVMEWVAAQVAPYKRLAAVTVVDAIPRSPSGKILRRMLVPTG